MKAWKCHLLLAAASKNKKPACIIADGLYPKFYGMSQP